MRTIRLGMLGIGVASLLGLTWHAPVHAETLVDKNVRVSVPSMPTSEALSFTSAGVLSVSVTDLLWPQALQNLSFAISDHDSVLKSKTGTGSLMFDIVTPGTYFANVYAAPNMLSGVGMYHLNVSFMPTVVPLPAAVWLLVSGIFGLTRLLRSKKNASAQVTLLRKAGRTRNRSSGDASFGGLAHGFARAVSRRMRRENAAAARSFVTSPIVQ